MSEQPQGGSPFEQPDFSQLGEVEEDVLEDLEEDDDEEYPTEEPEQAAGEQANAVDGGKARTVLEHLARSIVEDKDAIVIETQRQRGQLRLFLHVAPSDMGRIIGRRGRTAQAVRTLVRAAAATENDDAFVEIVD